MKGNNAIILALFLTLAGSMAIYFFWVRVLQAHINRMVEERNAANAAAATAAANAPTA